MTLDEAEQDLWAYPTLCDRVEASRPEGSTGIIWWQPHGSEPTSPVERHVIRVEDALSTVAAADRLKHRLTRDERRLVKLRYWQRRDWPDVARRLHMHEATALRWRAKILSLYLTIR